jgi:hypothetical protein
MSESSKVSGSRILWRTGWVAGAAFLAVVPYAYRTSTTFAQVLERRAKISAEEALTADLGMMATLVVLAALIGSVFAERNKLAGIGDLGAVRRAWRYVAVAPVLAVASYFVFGRALAARLPGWFPSELEWALLYAIKGAVFDEVVARYGMMTVFAGLTRIWVANLLQAIFFTAMIWKGLGFFGMAASWDGPFIAAVVSSFGLHLLFGGVCARHGLLSAMCVHLVYDLRFALHALLL